MYKRKEKKFNISPSLIEYCLYREDMAEIKYILESLKKSKTKKDFQEKIKEFAYKNDQYSIQIPNFLVGNITGNYVLNEYCNWEKINKDNISNFDENNKEILEILKENFFEYIINENRIKNKMYGTLKENDSVKNFFEELTEEKIKKIFDESICNDDIGIGNTKYNEVKNYIYRVLNNYSLEDIKNNFDFILYELKNETDKSIEERKKEYQKFKDNNIKSPEKIQNLKKLEENLKKIKTKESEKLLERLHKIIDIYSNDDEIEDIFLEYEHLFRQDIVNRLYTPTQEETIVEDFRQVKPQLIHAFLRTPKKFEDLLKENLKTKIINERNNGNKDTKLTEEEQKRFEKLLNLMEKELNQTQVNYSFDTSGMVYSGSFIFDFYSSDTSNQISASIYSENYFINNPSEVFGIGFNNEGLTPEAIVISSERYLTTNKGINNLEYDEKNEFEVLSCPYEDLVKNDGKSEVLMYRRNIDYDTKASYVFYSFDETRPESIEYINKVRKLAQDNNLKLDLYNIRKIKESYERYMKEQEEPVEERRISK